MLVVPLSSCIADTDQQPVLSTNIADLGDFPTINAGITLPGEYSIEYTDPSSTNEPVTKQYGNSFAYSSKTS